MTPRQQELDRIREEEIVRLEVRRQFRRDRQPQLVMMALLWAVALTLLAVVSPHLRRA